MSKNIVIQQSGVAENLTVDALRLNKCGGGNEDWVPADGKSLVKLDVGGSGTYKASDYDAYGIASIKVHPRTGDATSAAVPHAFNALHLPAVKEGGAVYNFSAKLISVGKQGGGTCEFVPGSEVALGTKSVTQSGTYRAKNDGYYGYSQVTVSGVDVEIITDGDGDTAARITDGGETKEIKLPSSIVVEQPPYITQYTDGQTIDFTGMIVKAYLQSGGLWTDDEHPDGVIPLSELTLPVTVADYDSATGKKATSDLIPDPFEFDKKCIMAWERTWHGAVQDYLYVYTMDDGAVCSWFINQYSSHGVRASDSPDALMTETEYPPDGSSSSSTSGLNLSYTHNGKTVYYGAWTHGWGLTDWDAKSMSPDGSAASGYDDGIIAWTMIYGDITDGGQIIPVQWARPYDSEILSASFVITVGQAPPSPSDGDDESGNGQWIDLL